MTKVIYCDCGLVCRGETDEELLANAEQHLRSEHPAVADQVRREDLVRMAVEVRPSPARSVQTGARSASLLTFLEGPVATLVLNRPERRNALSLELLRELSETLREVGADPEVRAIVIGAAGPVFCAGHDLKEMRGQNEHEYRALFEADAELMQCLHGLPQPIIARVQGIATAGGCHLVAACDLAVAARDARFAVPGPRMGLTGSTAMVEVARAVGRKRALQLLFTGQPISAETALEWGLVNLVVAPDELEAAAVSLAMQTAAGSAAIGGLAKRSFYEGLDLALAAAYAHATEVTWRSLPSADAQEGIAAFLERRQPIWSRTSPATGERSAEAPRSSA